MQVKQTLLNHKKKIPIIASVLAIGIILIIIISFFNNSHKKDVEFFILDDSSNINSSQNDNGISENLEQENQKDFEDLFKDEDIKETDKKLPIEEIDINKYEEYITNLYKKINNIEIIIENLQENVQSLKKTQFSQSIVQNPSKANIIIIELYKIQHLALNGKDFSVKTRQVIKIGKNIIGLKKPLEKLANLKKLSSKKDILAQINSLENDFYISQHKKKDSSVKEKFKTSVANYFSIKKIKNFGNKDVFKKAFHQLKNDIISKDYQNAQMNINLLNKKLQVTESLLIAIDNQVKFEQYFNQIINLILL